MSDDMAVGDNATGEEAKVNGEDVAPRSADAESASLEPPSEPGAQQDEEPAPLAEGPTNFHITIVKEEIETREPEEEPGILDEPPPEATDDPEERPNTKPALEPLIEDVPMEDQVDSTDRGIKRRASEAFSDGGEEFKGFGDAPPEEEFKGFESVDEKDVSVDYSRILERLEAEVEAAKQSYTPLKTVVSMAIPRASKRLRQDTDGSRPSSALSSRSDGEGALSNDGTSAASSPANRRRATTEMSSPLLRVPLERGWKRELVYRAALDAHSRRNADIYYYTPQGKKLRSTREVGEQLSGTGLTLENFSFFKEPLGVDDPEKEIIRDAKLMRKAESPITSAPPPSAVVEGKRTPKPKPPKGASPEPATLKSPPAKIKVKSVGSRLSTGGSAGTPTNKSSGKKTPVTPAPAAPATPAANAPAAPAPPTDNNNSAAWKKPRQPAPASAPPAPLAPPVPSPPVTPPPPPLQSRPAPQTTPDIQSPRQVMQPCSMTCGRGVPTLSCAACLCLYHPACAGHRPSAPPDTFYCKNCRKSTSPSLEPPPLIHKSGIPGAASGALVTPTPRRVPASVSSEQQIPIPVPVPVAPRAKQDKRVTLRMKVAGGGPDGERVWAVAKPPPPPPPKPQPPPPPKPQPPPRAHAPAPAPRAPAPTPRPALPQSLALINGRRFIIVPRSMVQPPQHHEEKRTRGRVANGAASPTDVMSRRGRRQKPDETDHFTALYNKAKEHNYNVVVQIFQYVGMRELAVCARVCRLWRALAATPALWRHVRMKNQHVSDWGGLCAALKRHGTARLDLRKMLLPPNDAVFWQQFAQHIPTVDTLERIEMCRCPASAVEAVCRGLPNLKSLSALAIRDPLLDPTPLGALKSLQELRIKSMSGLTLTRDLRPLAALTNLHHLSLTSIKKLGSCASDIIGQLEQLESLELGECTFRAEFATVLGRLRQLRRLRLERGTADCAAPQILRVLATLPKLTRLELVNIDVKVGFDDALAACTNIQRLLIIPTYVSQSATTNKQVLSGVLRLKDTLTHLMWGVTIELLRVTELFIDQCEQAGEPARRDLGECIPVLKPVPGCKLPDHQPVQGPPQVEILPLPTLQRLLSAQLPHTKLKLLRIPFHATWRQTLADFQ